MKRMIVLGMVILLGLTLVSCKPSKERRFRVYENGEQYTVGDCVYESAEIRRVEIDWLGGSVEVQQSAMGRASVLEECDLSEEKQLHTRLDEGVLRIKYCQTGHFGKIDEGQKNLQVYIPKGVELVLNTLHASVYLGVIETGALWVETDGGCIEMESVLCTSAEIKTNGGYIGVGSLTAERLSIENAVGEIHMVVPDCKNCEIETQEGDVTLYLLGDVSALIAFETKSGTLQTERKYQKKENGYWFATSDKKEDFVASSRISVRTERGVLRVR